MKRALDCPRCGLTLSVRTAWLTVEHCPRCIARDRLLVDMQERTPVADADLPAEVA